MVPVRTPASPAAALTLAGAAAAAFGGLRLASAAPPAGAPIPIVPLLALVGGACVFGIGARLADGRRGPASPPLGEAPGDGPDPGASRRWIVAAFLLGVLVTLVYAIAGYHPLLLLGWIGSWGLATAGLWPARARRVVRLEPGEAWLLGLVLLASCLLLLPYLSRIPYEISTDEIYSVRAVRGFADGFTHDAFGLVSWWGLPALWFAAVGWLAPLLGTSIEAVRLVTAVTALLVAVPFYLWARALHGRTVATVATVLLAFAHAFIGWGRLALHQNSPLLLLALGLALLATGLGARCPLRVLWGGIALGCGFYTYPSGQIVIVVWLAALLAWLGAGRLSRNAFLRVAGVSLLGFLLAALPMLMTALLHFGDFTERARAVAVTSPGAVERLGQVWGMSGSGDIVHENVKRALLSFNAPYPYVTYDVPGQPLLDPATGILLWLGLGLAVSRFRLRGPSLAAIGFGLVYAAGFLTEGAPVHGRLLIALPFVAVLAAEALVRLATVLLPDGGRAGRGRGWALAVSLVAIVALNLAAFRSFVRHQMAAGPNDAVTAIGRTLGVGIELEGPLERYFGQGREWDPRDHVFFLSPEEAPLFRWAGPPDWHAWIAFFSDSAHVHRVEGVDDFLPGGTADFEHGFWNRAVLFLPTSVWERSGERLLERFPRLERTTITPNRRLTEIEIRR